MISEPPRPACPKGGNDRVYTPDDLASQIAAHFKPSGRVLEPCRGGGAFTRAMPGCDWCEIEDGRDFMAVTNRYDWIVTNPPYSKFRAFLNHSLMLADNVVFLAPVIHLLTRARWRDSRRANFGFVEIVTVPTPPEPWPQAGFQIAVTHLKRGYLGPCKFTHWD